MFMALDINSRLGLHDITPFVIKNIKNYDEKHGALSELLGNHSNSTNTK